MVLQYQYPYYENRIRYFPGLSESKFPIWSIKKKISVNLLERQPKPTKLDIEMYILHMKLYWFRIFNEGKFFQHRFLIRHPLHAV